MRIILRKIFIVLVITISLVNLSGCRSSQNSTSGVLDRAEIIVSRNFGKEIISQNEVEIPRGAALLHIMEDNFQVETAYGGSFINKKTKKG